MNTDRNICTKCDAIYEQQDVQSSKKSFESLPEDWKCACGASKSDFKSCSCVSVVAGEKGGHKHEPACGHANSV